MIPGDLVYIGSRKSNAMLPVTYQLKEDLVGKQYISRIRHIECGTPGILLETTHPCQLLTKLGVIYVNGNNLCTFDEYEELLRRVRGAKFEIKPLKIPTGLIFYLTSSYGSK